MKRVERVPAIVVTGFLGAGKTTLVNALLGRGRLGRVAALVNDFGALDIDAALIETVADEVVQLTNGCVCCSINGDLYAAVGRVLDLEPAIDFLVIETTGVADPLPVGLTLLRTDISARVALEAMVTVVDCANFALDLFAADAAMAQIAHADIIVLNKTDLAGAEAIASIERRITLIKPRARLLRAVHGNIPLAVIADKVSSALVFADQDQGAAHHHHLLDDGFVAHAIAVPGPLDGRLFQRLIDSLLPAAVYRAKGILRFGSDSGWHVFQFCAGRASFDRFAGTVESGRLVFIGQGIEPASLDSAIAACALKEPVSA